ncbi:MAG: restriction endonuclease subunit S [Halopseudomonas yangmingensis]
MSSEVLEHSLASLCLLVADCPHATPEWTASGVVVLRNQNIKGGRLDLSAPSFTDEAHYLGRIRRAAPQEGDLVITREAPMGEVCQIPAGLKCCLGQRQVLLRPDPEKVDSRFLLYALQSPYLQHQIGWNEGTGSTVSNLRIPVLEALKVPTPSVATQREVASVLGALDDRITLLRETNATLEAIAQALFKSWFVDFDPVRAKAEGRARQDGERSGQPRMPQASDLPRPGAEAGAEAQGQPEGMDAATAALFPDSFEESELGLVPKGWRVGKVEDVMDLPYGKALKSTDRIDGVVPVYGSGGITGYHKESLVDGPSIIVGRKGTVGSLYWEDRPFFPIDTVFYVKSKQPLTYCYYLLQTLGLESMNTDGAVPGLNRNNAYRLQVVVPSAPALQAFDEIVAVVREKIFANSQQAQTLTQLRDTLLPRLISGQLRLPEAEATVEEVL